MKTPIPRSYWVEEGVLLAGEYPGAANADEAAAKLALFREAGIDFFLDLTEEGERNHDGFSLRPYARAVAPATVSRFPVRDLDVPTVDEMAAILSEIDHAIDRGRCVYVHCWGGVGRTGTVVACWLIRRGLSADEAIEFIRERRRGKPAGDRPSPETAVQHGFIRDRARREAVVRHD